MIQLVITIYGIYTYGYIYVATRYLSLVYRIWDGTDLFGKELKGGCQG